MSQYIKHNVTVSLSRRMAGHFIKRERRRARCGKYCGWPRIAGYQIKKRKIYKSGEWYARRRPAVTLW